MNEQLIEKIKKEKVIAIVRGVNPQEILPVVKALYAGGIKLVEITYTQDHPETWSETAECIQTIKSTFSDKLSVGAGTVTHIKQVEMTKEVGAEFILSPNFDAQIVKKTKDMGLLSIPGALTPSEIMDAYECGADFVKVFPASDLGSGFIKAILSPIKSVPLLAVGGIGSHNVLEFLKAGAVGVGIGGELTKKEWIEKEEYYKIQETAEKIVEIVHNLN